MEFYIVLIKKSWIRNAEIRGGEETETWMPAKLSGHAGIYLAQSTQKACEYAADEYGYPINCFAAMSLNRILIGDLKEFEEYETEI